MGRILKPLGTKNVPNTVDAAITAGNCSSFS